MARSRIPDVSFLRLPPATAVLLLSAVFGMTSGHALPRQTKTVALHDLNVVPFPPRPTEGPILLSDVLRRQTANTVCGYIGGNPDLPATCLAGSHCVLEQDHGVVGCCPDGGTCQSGIYTGCVDFNSGVQTESNPYVYTCQGSDVCYRNDFAGGYFQFGCGTASSLGTTVETFVDGMTSLVFEETSVPLTELPSPLPEPTTVGTQPTSATSDPDDPDDPSETPSSDPGTTQPATSAPDTPTQSTSDPLPPVSSSSTFPTSPSTISSSLSSSSSSSSTALTSSTFDVPNTTADATSSDDAATESATDTSAPAAGTGTSTTNRGAIIGGSISGAAVLVGILVAAILLYLRKRRGNNREGPGPLPTDAPPRTEYISPTRSHGAAFAPLPSWHDDDEDRRPLTQYNSQPYYAPNEPWQQQPPQPQPGPSTAPAMAMAPARTANTSRGFSQPLRYHPAAAHAGGVPVGTGLAPVAEEDQQFEHESEGIMPPPRNPSRQRVHSSEIDDFSRAYSSAGIGSEDDDEDYDVGGRHPLAVMNPDVSPPHSGTASPGGSQSPNRGGGSGSGSGSGGGGAGIGNRPLWQQNRQQGRNLMWL
ncbi:hypothetical protein GGR53DRAFT_136390 [Hypoxylon sp. FL1150]|nr:hypothetical protein GGR53DRAFT_136390 [Hypoxylon sp. FL1150]